MEKAEVLLSINEKRVDFLGETITLALVWGELEYPVYITVRPICTAFDISWSGQYRRIKNNPILSKECRHVKLLPNGTGGSSTTICLPMPFLLGWLLGLTPNRIKPQHSLGLISCKKWLYQMMGKSSYEEIFSGGFEYDFSVNECLIDGMTAFSMPQMHAIVRNQCDRAARLGLPCSLTVGQWMFVLKTFNGKCAYCQEKPGVLLEHFIPLSLGLNVGTAIDNCVPSCFSCNSKKSNKHPSEVTLIPQEAIDRVRRQLEYLESQFPF